MLTSLQDAIDHECKMRDAASKLLQLSKSTQHNMEASKGKVVMVVSTCTCKCLVYIMYYVVIGLFVSNMKILELMKELQHTHSDTGKGVCIDNTDGELKPCQARIGISSVFVSRYTVCVYMYVFVSRL